MAKARRKTKDSSINPQSPGEGQPKGNFDPQATPISPPESVKPTEEPGVVETPQVEQDQARAEKSQVPETVDQEVPPGQEPSSKGPLLGQLMANPSFRKLVISRLIRKLR